MIVGYGILDFAPSLRSNSNLKMLDLATNMIDNDCAKAFINVLMENYSLEDVNLESNTNTHMIHKDKIQAECDKNIMIQQNILPKLKKLRSPAISIEGEPEPEKALNTMYDVSELTIKKEKF
jgi:hypothetical protein